LARYLLRGRDAENRSHVGTKRLPYAFKAITALVRLATGQPELRECDMTRKDFELIATAIRKTRATVDADDWQRRGAIDAVSMELGRVLGSTNPNFDAERFERACNVEGE
jgi:hypothetical protein